MLQSVGIVKVCHFNFTYGAHLAERLASSDVGVIALIEQAH